MRTMTGSLSVTTVFEYWHLIEIDGENEKHTRPENKQADILRTSRRQTNVCLPRGMRRVQMPGASALVSHAKLNHCI